MVAFLGCTDRRGTGPPSPEGGASSPGPAAAPRPARPGLLIPDGGRAAAPDFFVRTTSGAGFALTARRGHLVVLSFLAPGCESCKEEVDALRAVEPKVGSGGVLLLDVGGLTDNEITHYYQGELGGGDHLYAGDEGLRVARPYEVISLGTTVVIDPSGRVAYRDERLTSPAHLLSVVREALEQD